MIDQAWLTMSGGDLQFRYAVAANADTSTTTSVGEAFLLCRPLPGKPADILAGIKPEVQALYDRLWLVHVQATVSFNDDERVKFTFTDMPFTDSVHGVICNIGSVEGGTMHLRDAALINENYGYSRIHYRSTVANDYTVWFGYTYGYFGIDNSNRTATIYMHKTPGGGDELPYTSKSGKGISGTYTRDFLIGEKKAVS